MSKAGRKIATFFIVVTATLAIAGEVAAIPWLVYFFKPFATIVIIWMASANWRAHQDRYALWVTAGLILSLAGDILLIWPARYFFFGLVAFLLTHIAYLIAFTRGAEFPERPMVWLFYLAIGAAIYAVLWSRLPIFLRFPVAFYTLFLSGMAAQALGRFPALRAPAARFAAIGAAFFLLSDTLLAADRFYAPFPLAALFILATYYLAQWLIASSTRRESLPC
jgi:uncharacterized membrane protein YhhN